MLEWSVGWDVDGRTYSGHPTGQSLRKLPKAVALGICVEDGSAAVISREYANMTTVFGTTVWLSLINQRIWFSPRLNA